MFPFSLEPLNDPPILVLLRKLVSPSSGVDFCTYLGVTSVVNMPTIHMLVHGIILLYAKMPTILFQGWGGQGGKMMVEPTIVWSRLM